MRVAFHNHTSTDPDEVSSPESFREVLALSPLFRINLDVAHFAAGGHDAVAFLKEQHTNITNLHMHDRKANAGDSVPFGEGVAPAQAVLRMLRDNGWKIPVFYELEYVGGDGRDVIAETARELAYERKILES
jgi:sugar phosphate isomerase/epimerase